MKPRIPMPVWSERQDDSNRRACNNVHLDIKKAVLQLPESDMLRYYSWHNKELERIPVQQYRIYKQSGMPEHVFGMTYVVEIK